MRILLKYLSICALLVLSPPQASLAATQRLHPQVTVTAAQPGLLFRKTPPGDADKGFWPVILLGLTILIFPPLLFAFALGMTYGFKDKLPPYFKRFCVILGVIAVVAWIAAIVFLFSSPLTSLILYFTILATGLFCFLVGLMIGATKKKS